MFHKEKLTTTPYQKVLNLLSFLLFLGLFLYPVLIWSKIPDEIPTHYNFAGEADAFGSKSSILIPSLIGALLYGLLLFVGHFPDIWNVPVKITAENKDWVYRNIKSLLSTMDFLIMLLYFYINYRSASQKDLNPVIIIGVIIFLFTSILYFCLRCKKTPPSPKDVS